MPLVIIALLAVPALAVVFFVAICFGAAHHFVRQHGLVKVLYRMATGHHLDGHHRTNRGWLTKGTRPVQASTSAALHQRTTRWSRTPRVHRAAVFWSPLLFIPLAVIGAIADLTLTAAILAALTLATLAAFGLRAAHRAGLRDHRRHVEHPTALALAGTMGMAAAVVAENLRIIPRIEDARPGDTVATIKALPDHRAWNEAEQATVEGVLQSRIGGELDFDWQLTRHPMRLLVTCGAMPPDVCHLADHIGLIESLDAGKYFLGTGKNDQPVIWDSELEDPMVAVNAKPRRGKTNLNFAIAAQALRRGERVTAVDPKVISLVALAGIDGFELANDPGDVAAMWRAVHSVRVRMEAAKHVYGQGGQPPDRELLIIEEANQTFALWRDAWEAIKPPGARIGDAPPWQDCRAILHQGPQLGFHLLIDGQDLKDAILFGARSSFGTVALSGWSPQQWGYLVGTTPVPAAPTRRGRFVMPHDGDRVWFQAVIADSRGGKPNEAAWRAYASDGLVPHTRGWTRPAAPDWTRVRPRLALPHREQRAIPAVIIGNKAAATYLGMTLAQFRNQRQRHPIDGEFTTDMRRKQPQPAWQREALDRWKTSLMARA